MQEQTLEVETNQSQRMKEVRITEKNSRDESNFTYNFQPDSLAQTAHHCQVPELKKKKKRKKTKIKRKTAKEYQVRSFMYDLS